MRLSAEQPAASLAPPSGDLGLISHRAQRETRPPSPPLSLAHTADEPSSENPPSSPRLCASRFFSYGRLLLQRRRGRGESESPVCNALVLGWLCIFFKAPVFLGLQCAIADPVTVRFPLKHGGHPEEPFEAAPPRMFL